MVKILLILLLLPIGVQPAEDTTRVWCSGEGCRFFESPNDYWFGGCDSTVPRILPINCRFECIDDVIYRICEEPDIKLIFIDSLNGYDTIFVADYSEKYSQILISIICHKKTDITYRDSVVQVCKQLIYNRYPENGTGKLVTYTIDTCYDSTVVVVK